MSKRFALLNDDNIVLDVVVAESKQWCIDNLGGNWIETTEDNLASKNFTYDPISKKFINTPMLEALLNEEEYLKSSEYQKGLSYEQYKEIITNLAQS